MNRSAFRSRPLVTTSSSLDGWEIERHLGLVSVHRVAGTGLISDVFASFSDLLGGRSESYGKQLSSLYLEATEMLQQRAEAIGGNAVVGLHIDFDEISGQGKSMFMLNAVGTAVVARRSAQAPLLEADGESPPLTGEVMEVLIRRNQFMAQVAEQKVRMTDDVWALATEHAWVEFAPYALNVFLSSEYQYDEKAQKTLLLQAHAYFAAIPLEAAKRTLYRGLISVQTENFSGSIKRTKGLRDACVQMIINLSLVDYERLAEALRKADPDGQRSAMRVAQGHPMRYMPEDLPRLRELASLLAETFPEYWKPTAKRGIFGGEKEAWACGCGKVVGADEARCGSCNLDAWGFREREYHRNAALWEIQQRIRVLEGTLPDKARDTASGAALSSSTPGPALHA